MKKTEVESSWACEWVGPETKQIYLFDPVSQSLIV